jgi:hypothetical protein
MNTEGMSLKNQQIESLGKVKKVLAVRKEASREMARHALALLEAHDRYMSTMKVPTDGFDRRTTDMLMIFLGLHDGINQRFIELSEKIIPLFKTIDFPNYVEKCVAKAIEHLNTKIQE